MVISLQPSLRASRHWHLPLAHPGPSRWCGCSMYGAQSTSCTQSTKAKSAWALPLDRWERRFSSRLSLSRRYSLRMGSYSCCCCGHSNDQLVYSVLGGVVAIHSFLPSFWVSAFTIFESATVGAS